MIIDFVAEDSDRYLHQSDTLKRVRSAMGAVTLRVPATVDWNPTVVSVLVETIRIVRLRGSHVRIEASPIKAATLRRLGFSRLAAIVPLLPSVGYTDAEASALA